jgi:hypothetical protein
VQATVPTSYFAGLTVGARISATPTEVAGRSLLLFVLQPYRTRDRSTATERSLQRVFQAMDDAATKSVRFGCD